MSNMNDREIHILDAGLALFLRYGVKRTSMNDIAHEAGIARQTLYNAFANKDAVLRATIQLFTQRAMAEIETGLQSCRTLADQLDVIFAQLAIKPYELLHASPNAEDIILGMNAASRDEIAENEHAFRAVLAKAFESKSDALSSAGLSPEALAEITQISVSAAKEKAADRAHLERLLASTTSMILAIVNTQDASHAA
ncbi:MAG: helix-turn-helix domain-containing protein [Pseudomonadota bacterium]